VIVGIGIDLVELSRVERSLDRWGPRLVGKLMAPPEASRLPAPAPERVRAVASAIALKEAASKALGTGWSSGVFWRDVVADAGAPAVTLSGGAARVAAWRKGDETRAWLEIQGDLVIAEVWLLR
jgi:holo-[acyl-carrier protein] synthase